MPKKPSHYSTAEMLWNSTAYCDQWEEVMALYDENGILRMVVTKDDQTEAYDVLLIGTWNKVLYRLWGGISFKTMRQSMASCFNLHLGLKGRHNPTFVACEQNKTKKQVPEVLTHSRSNVIRHGGFHQVEDAFEEIEIAKKYLQLAKAELEPNELFYDYEAKSFTLKT